MQVDTKPKDYIKHHNIGTGEHLQANDRGKDKGNFRSWNEPNVRLKMYDASRNILMKQGLQRQGIIEEAGWNPEGHFLKWEAHYVKPEVLNQGRALILANLVDRHWEEIFKADLYNQYKRLIPMKTIVTPTNKKDLGSADIVLLSLAELQINEGISLEELKKILYDKINSIPDEVLTKADKDSRKRQIKAMLDKIVEEPESRWDLSEKDWIEGLTYWSRAAAKTKASMPSMARMEQIKNRVISMIPRPNEFNNGFKDLDNIDTLRI